AGETEAPVGTRLDPWRGRGTLEANKSGRRGRAPVRLLDPAGEDRLGSKDDRLRQRSGPHAGEARAREPRGVDAQAVAGGRGAVEAEAAVGRAARGDGL